jgi:hypothetical protein
MKEGGECQVTGHEVVIAVQSYCVH